MRVLRRGWVNPDSQRSLLYAHHPSLYSHRPFFHFTAPDPDLSHGIEGVMRVLRRGWVSSDGLEPWAMHESAAATAVRQLSAALTAATIPGAAHVIREVRLISIIISILISTRVNPLTLTGDNPVFSTTHSTG